MVPPELATRIADAIAKDLMERTGRHEEEKLGQMIAIMTMDPGLRGIQREWTSTIESVISDYLAATPLHPVASTRRTGKSKATARGRRDCMGGPRNCSVHNAPMGADLLCDWGRGGKLVLPAPAAQKRRSVKKTVQKRSSR